MALRGPGAAPRQPDCRLLDDQPAGHLAAARARICRVSETEPRAEADAQRRWLSPQPNLTGLGIIASYSRRFWALLIVLGVITGLTASALIWLLRLVERLTYGLPASHRHPHRCRRARPGMAADCSATRRRRDRDRGSAGAGTQLDRRDGGDGGDLAAIGSPRPPGERRQVDHLDRDRRHGRLARPRGGAAVGRRRVRQPAVEWATLPAWQRRLLVASGAGAGFAAVYNVPLGGTLLALEVMLGTLALPLVLPALLTSVTATAVAWIFLGTGRSTTCRPRPCTTRSSCSPSLMGPIIGLVAVGWTRLIAAANAAGRRGVGRCIAPITAFGVLGLLSLQYPQLLGNGRAIVQLAIVGNFAGPDGGAAGAEAAGHGRLHRGRGAGWAVHADLCGRGAARGRRWLALVARLARRRGRRVTR